MDALATLAAQPGARVAFTAAGPAGMKIVGTTSELAAAGDAKNVSVTVTLTHLTTGIDLRDKHMREKYLETPTYPTAVLIVPRTSIVFPAAGASTTADAQGTLTLHGQTKPSAFHYTATNDGASYRVDGLIHVNMQSYGINVPSYLGITVKPDVDVEVHFTATDR
jgi:polyisoprenoid-binding protein YceI